MRTLRKMVLPPWAYARFTDMKTVSGEKLEGIEILEEAYLPATRAVFYYSDGSHAIVQLATEEDP